MNAQVDIKQNIEYSFKKLIEYTHYANESVNDLNIFWDIYEDYFPPEDGENWDLSKLSPHLLQTLIYLTL